MFGHEHNAKTFEDLLKIEGWAATRDPDGTLKVVHWDNRFGVDLSVTIDGEPSEASVHIGPNSFGCEHGEAETVDFMLSMRHQFEMAAAAGAALVSQ
jgi:hypothetical protein